MRRTLRTIAAAALLMAVIPAAAARLYAQPKTLFDGDLESGGFGGFEVKVGNINGQLGMLAGGGGAWVINHSFYIGGAGYGVVTEHTTQDWNMDTVRIGMGYGGGIIGVQIAPDELIHFGAQTLVGAGGVSHQYGRSGFSFDNKATDPFFIVEPAITAELNFTAKLRMAFNGSYRFVSGVDLPGVTNKGLSGPSAGVMLRYGVF